jgi:O-antigen/teichoic acid export membrane protein
VVSSLLVARAVEPVTFGAYLAWFSVALLAAVAWDAGVSVLVQRELARRPRSASVVITRALRLRLTTFPVWGLAFALGLAILQSVSDVDVATAALFIGASFAASLRSLATAVLHSRMQFGRGGAALAAGRWSTACASVLVLVPEQEADRLTVAAAAVLAGESIALAVTLAAVGRIELLASEGHHGITLRNALPLAANAAMVQTYNRMDVLLVALLTSAAQVGMYAPASRIQDALYALPGAVGAVALSLFSREFGQERSLERVRSWVVTFVATGVVTAGSIAVVLTVFMPTAVELVLGKAYLESVPAARIMVWSVVASSVVAPLVAALIATGHAGDTTKVYGATLAVALLLHFSLDWWAGAIGAAVASLGRDAGGVVVAVFLAARAGLLPGGITLRRFWPRAVSQSGRPSK